MLSWFRRRRTPEPAPPAPAATPPSANPDELMRKAWPLHQAGDVEQAARLYREILALDPGYADAHYLLGRIEQDAGRDAEAIPHFRSALRGNDREQHFHRSLAEAHYALGHWDEAIGYFHNAVELDPGDFECWTNLGCACQKLGRLAEATRHFEKAVAIQPDSPQALNNVAMALKDRGRLDEALATFRRALELAPDFKDLFGNYLYALNFSPRLAPAEVFEAHAGYDRVFGSGRFGTRQPPVRDPDPERRLRVAYFSPDLRAHPVSVFLEPVLVHHDRSRVEVHCYHLHPLGDAVTRRLRGLADHWLEAGSLSDEQLAQRLRDDRIDIVVDLAGHTGDNRLPVLGRKPAPVIATWLGYPNTTGLKTVDYRITDAACDPPGAERYHTEQVLRLAGAQWCFTQPDVPADVTPLPAAGDGLVRFASFNNASKLNDAMVRTWARILARIERSTLLVWGVGHEQAARIREVVREAGVDPARLEFSDRTPFAAQLALYQRTDIALDTFPYSGVTTTFNSLWMGVPMLSLAGEVSASRSTLSILQSLGLGDWIATTPEALVETAVRKAADLPGLAALRGGLRARLEASPLMDGPAFARKLEDAYRQMWRECCRAVVRGKD